MFVNLRVVDGSISIHALLAESDKTTRKVKQTHWDFYPRSPCGERHAPNRRPCPRSKFLSTLSLRRATLGAWKSCDVRGISIHALLAESDKRLGLLGWLRVLISIHALLAESDR